jgi:hypothetical protein
MKKYYVTIIVGIACALIFFFIGRATVGTTAAVAVRGAGSSSTRGSFAGRAGAGGGFVAGQIVSADAQSVTVQLANGNSEVVFYSSSTQIIKPQPATVAALTSGTRVLVGGTANSDGSVTASTIQIQTGAGAPNMGVRVPTAQ